MKFKRIEIIVAEFLSQSELKQKALSSLNLVQKPSSDIALIAEIKDLYSNKLYICVDTETKNTLGLKDELISIETFTNMSQDTSTRIEKLLEDFQTKFDGYDATFKSKIQDTSEQLKNLLDRTKNDIQDVTKNINETLVTAINYDDLDKYYVRTNIESESSLTKRGYYNSENQLQTLEGVSTTDLDNYNPIAHLGQERRQNTIYTNYTEKPMIVLIDPSSERVALCPIIVYDKQRQPLSINIVNFTSIHEKNTGYKAIIPAGFSYELKSRVPLDIKFWTEFWYIKNAK